MNIDLGYLGKVVLTEMSEINGFVFDEMTFIMDGYTESGIRVHGVLDNREYITYPRCWRDAILIKV